MNVSQLFHELSSVMAENKMELNDNLGHSFGNEGYVTVFPMVEEEIVNVLKFANESGKRVVIAGNETKKGYGGIAEPAHIKLSLVNYEGVLEHTPANMTVTVKSGTNFQKLQSYLKEYEQRIPLDPKLPKEATVGGVIATNDSGPKRFGYGSARDCVIGLKMVYPDGSIIRSGGKVVKNVAGYDMNKLFIGSMGTLGVISEVTFRLRPLPREESLIFLAFDHGKEEEIRSFAVEMLDTQLEPVSLELLTPHFAERLIGQKSYTLVIAFEDVSKAIEYEENHVEKLIKGKNIRKTVHKGTNLQDFWDRLYSSRPIPVTTQVDSEETRAVLKIGVINLDVIPVLKEGEKLADSHHISIEGHGGLGHGLCEVALTGNSDAILQVIKELRQFTENLGGYVVVTHLPQTLRKEISVWGDKPEHFFLLEGIKRKIDPNKTLNAGRFVGGI